MSYHRPGDQHYGRNAVHYNMRRALAGDRPPRLLDPTLGGRYLGVLGDAQTAVIKAQLNARSITALQPPAPINPLAPPSTQLVAPSSATYSLQNAMVQMLRTKPLLDTNVINLMRQGVATAQTAPGGFQATGEKQSNGKVKVDVQTFWNDWNDNAAWLMSPCRPAIMAIGVLPLSWRQKICDRPLDAILDIFDPIEDRVGNAIDRVIAKKGAYQNYFGNWVDCRRVQPADAKLDTSTKNFMRRMRTMYAWCVLFFTQPVELAIQMAIEGVDILQSIIQAIGDVAGNIAEAVGDGLENARKVADSGVKAISNVASSVANGISNVIPNFGGVGGVGMSIGNYGLGADPVTAAAAAANPANAPMTAPVAVQAAPPVTAAGGISLEKCLALAIASITAAATSAAAAAVGKAVTAGVDMAGNAVASAVSPGSAPAAKGGTKDSDILLPGGMRLPSGSGAGPSSTSPASTGGLSTGAKIGIGVGVLTIGYALLRR